MFLNYGSRTEEKMLLNYGFVEDRSSPLFVQSLCLSVGLDESGGVFFCYYTLGFLNSRGRPRVRGENGPLG